MSERTIEVLEDVNQHLDCIGLQFIHVVKSLCPEAMAVIDLILLSTKDAAPPSPNVANIIRLHAERNAIEADTSRKDGIDAVLSPFA